MGALCTGSQAAARHVHASRMQRRICLPDSSRNPSLLVSNTRYSSSTSSLDMGLPRTAWRRKGGGRRGRKAPG